MQTHTPRLAQALIAHIVMIVAWPIANVPKNRLCVGWNSMIQNSCGQITYRATLMPRKRTKSSTFNPKMTFDIIPSPLNWYGSWWSKIEVMRCPC